MPTLASPIQNLEDPEETCPYVHIRDRPSTGNTTPTFDAIAEDTPALERQDDAAFHAMLHRGQHQPRTKLVTAIADTGASHVLLRESDAHVLEDVVFTPTRVNQAPQQILLQLQPSC